jgi:putative ABC transport system permease protein
MRATFLGAAVMLGVGIGFASFVAGWALKAGIATSFARMGADLVVVPRSTLVNITSSLLTVQPTQETLAADLADKIARIAGIARVAPQRIVPALVEGRRVNLIAFDPGNDFSILTWLEDHQSGPIEGLIAGGRLDAPTGTTLSVCGMSLPVHGRLRETGVGPFDESYFLRFETLADIVSFCRASGTAGGASAKPQQSLPALPREMGHADVCSPELPLDRVSAFLLQLLPGAKPEQVKFSLAQLADVKVVEGNPVLTSSRGALVALLIGIAAFTVLQLLALLMLLSLLFSAIVRERFREIGLLRALGANANQVMTVILAEAGIITGLGGIAGLAFGAAVLVTFARSLGYYFDLLGVPFSWPAAPVLQIGAIIAILFSAALGVAGALLPAWRVRRTAPHALIHANGS